MVAYKQNALPALVIKPLQIITRLSLFPVSPYTRFPATFVFPTADPREILKHQYCHLANGSIPLEVTCSVRFGGELREAELGNRAFESGVLNLERKLGPMRTMFEWKSPKAIIVLSLFRGRGFARTAKLRLGYCSNRLIHSLLEPIIRKGSQESVHLL